MTEKKGGINEELIKQLCLFIIFLLILFLIGLTGKFVEINHEKSERIKLGLLQSEKLEQLETEVREADIKRKKEFENYISNIDLLSDDSLTKFVNPDVSFNELSYVPESLVSISGEYIIDGKGGYIKVAKILKENLDKLSEQFYKDTNNNIVIVSGYRSYSYQKGIIDRGCSPEFCSKPGYSEHQSGLAIDIYSASSERNWVNDNNLRKYFSWFKDNAHMYGFHNSYQKGLEIDGYHVEPWHWRYVGEKFATYLYDNNMTIAEFYNKKNKEN